MELLLWSVWVVGLFAASLLVQVYVLYPVELAVLDFLRVKRANRPAFDDLPTVTLVIAAYNEADVIAEKIENSLEMEYPEEKLDIVVFSDESSDGTDDIVRSYAEEGVRLERIEGRVGKTECQNQVVSSLETDVVVFSDANSMYEPNAITELVNRFNMETGCVVGELRYVDEDGVAAEGVYWRFERLMKRLESAVGSVVTANGAIYAVRTDAYVPLPRDAISDFAEPLSMIESGLSVEYTPDAIAVERTAASVSSEMNRRVRIVTRSWNSMRTHATLLNPLRYPLFSFQLWSHKVLRWLSPVWLVLTLLASVVLVVAGAGTPAWLLFGGQAAFYALATLGAVTERSGAPSPMPIHVPYYFLLSNYAMALGLGNFLKGTNIVTWDTEDRERPSKPN